MNSICLLHVKPFRSDLGKESFCLDIVGRYLLRGKKSLLTFCETGLKLCLRQELFDLTGTSKIMEYPVPQNFIKVTKSWPLFPYIFKWLIWKWFTLFACLDVVPMYEVGGTQEYWELFPVVTPPLVQVPVVTPSPIRSFRACSGFQRSQVILHPSNCPVFLATHSIPLLYICTFTLFEFIF